MLHESYLWSTSQGQLSFNQILERSQADPILEPLADAVVWWNRLMENGVYVNLVLPPATPTNICLLRCSMSAAHTPEQVDRILDAYAALRQSSLNVTRVMAPEGRMRVAQRKE